MNYHQPYSKTAYRFFEARAERIRAYFANRYGVTTCHFCGRATLYAYCPWECP
jgi:hypothetical protein